MTYQNIMKISINKKSLLSACFALLVSAFWVSCDKDDIEYDEENVIEQEVIDSYLQIKTSVVSFQAGTEKYGLKMNAISGIKEPLQQVMVYSTFSDAVTGEVSDEVLLGTYDVEGLITTITDSLTYEDLKEGIVINGGSLPESDLDIPIGSGWVLRFEGVTTTGESLDLDGSVNIAVLSVYAGLYTVETSQYIRIDEDYGDLWSKSERFIGSVNDTIFSYNEAWGAFEDPSYGFNFDVDFDDYSIDLIKSSAASPGDYAITCADDASFFSVAPCEGSNILIPDPDAPESPTGKHRIILTYGYYVEGSGARQFYEVLVKK